MLNQHIAIKQDGTSRQQPSQVNCNIPEWSLNRRGRLPPTFRLASLVGRRTQQFPSLSDFNRFKYEVTGASDSRRQKNKWKSKTNYNGLKVLTIRLLTNRENQINTGWGKADEAKAENGQESPMTHIPIILLMFCAILEIYCVRVPNVNKNGKEKKRCMIHQL